MKEKPTRLGDALRQYLQSSGLDERMEEASALPEWAGRVGEAIASVTEPVRVSRGTLLVAVRSSSWLMELRLMEREILRRVNEGRTRGRIERIRFVMRGEEDMPEEPEAWPGRPRRPGRRRP